MFRFTRALVSLGLVLLSACSSAPPPPEAVMDRKNRAADYLQFGKQNFQEGQYEQALSFFLIALDLNTAVANDAGAGACFNSLGSTYLALNRPSEARAALNEGDKTALRTNDIPLQLQILAGQVQVDLAEGDAESAFQRLAKAQPFPDSKEGAALWHAQGVVQKARNQNEPALLAFQKALSLNTSLKLKQDMASNHFMIASVLSRQSRWTEALAELQLALELDRTMENSQGIGQDLRALGTISLRLGQKRQAFDFYERSLKVFQATGLATEQMRTVEALLPLTLDPDFAKQRDFYLALQKRLAGVL